MGSSRHGCDHDRNDDADRASGRGATAYTDRGTDTSEPAGRSRSGRGDESIRPTRSRYGGCYCVSVWGGISQSCSGLIL
ncbi:hypothetical protein D3C78_1188570 [compost metagenome]